MSTSAAGAQALPFHLRTCPVLAAVEETFDNPLNSELSENTPVPLLYDNPVVADTAALASVSL